MKHRYKIAIYAISKNEEKFVSRWYNSVKDADEIYVLDTGSTDQTVDQLKRLGVHVTEKKITPWRFDDARNQSLALVDKDVDICICIDLDEVLKEGWREELERIWEPDTTRLAYNYNWLLEDEIPKVNFYIEKIHSRFDYKWTHPVHEVLSYIGTGVEHKKTTDLITVNHYPDPTKSRSSYLELLELSVKEDPQDDRNMHYLGREYMYYGRWNECIDTLIRHLELPSATWRDERCASMRFIARSYQKLHRIREARMWLDLAIAEAPYLRDPYMERALLEYQEGAYDAVVTYCLKALEIENHAKTYINEQFSWDHTPYDLLSLGYYYTGDKNRALEAIEKAILISPGDERLLKNRELMKGEV